MEYFDKVYDIEEFSPSDVRIWIKKLMKDDNLWSDNNYDQEVNSVILNLYYLVFNKIVTWDPARTNSIRYCDRETSSVAGYILLALSQRDISIWRPKPQRLPDRNTAVGPHARFSRVNVDAIWDTLTSGRWHPPPGGNVTWTSFNPSSFTIKLGPSEISNVRSGYWMQNCVRK